MSHSFGPRLERESLDVGYGTDKGRESLATGSDGEQVPDFRDKEDKTPGRSTKFFLKFKVGIKRRTSLRL